MEDHLFTETVLTQQSEKIPLKLTSQINQELLPVYKDFIPLSCPNDQIIETFTRICKAQKFNLTYTSVYKLVAQYTPKFSFKKYFSCITGGDSEGLTQIELQIKIMSFPNQKLIIVQGLQGCKKRIAVLINAFKLALEKILKNRELYFHDQPTIQRIQSEVWNYLSTKAGREAIENLRLTLQNKFELRSIKSSVIQIIKLSYNHYPTSVKSQYLKVLEQSFFAKFSQVIQKHYKEQSQTSESQLKFHLEKLKHVQNSELFDRLGFKHKYRLEEEVEPYKKPIKLLGDLRKKNVPIEKLNVLHDVHVALKTSVLEYWKGKVELEGMDDILPIYIFVIIKADLHDLPTEICMLEDYLRVSQNMESEESLVVNYHVAIQYIVNGCMHCST